LWVVYSLLGLLALVVIAVLFVPIYARVCYDGELRAKIWVLGIPVTLLPAEPKAKKPKAKKSKKQPDKRKPSKMEELKELLRQDSVGGTLSFLKQMAGLVKKAVGRLLRAVTVDDLRLEMCIATDDPAVTAQRYGQVCGVLYPSLAALEHVVHVRRRHLRVEPNFLMEHSAVRFDLRLHLSVCRLLVAGVALLVGFVMIKEDTNSKEEQYNGKQG